MFVPDLVVRGRRIVAPRGIRAGAIHVRAGRIIGVLDFDDVPAGCVVDDVGDYAVLPGLVDPLVHVHEHGRSSSDAFTRTTDAAAAGGVTTVIAMPFDAGPQTTTAAALESKCRAAQGHCLVDVGFWGGVVPGNRSELTPLFNGGVLGFVCTLAHSGDDTSSPVSEADLRAAMPALARLGSPLLARPELAGPIDRAAAQLHANRTWVDRFTGGWRLARQYTTYLSSRPRAAENEAIALLIQICQESRVPIHVAPLSSSDALTALFRARSAGLPISATTCPHYLLFVADEVPNGAVEFKCAPPIRERENREFLWAALAGGLIQSVASDHRVRESNTRNFVHAPSGIASLQLSLSITWTEANARAYTLEQIVRWMCSAPANLAGLDRKGSIDVGYDADLVVFDPEAEFTVDAETSVTQGGETPYRGRRLRGVVERTYLRGVRVYEHGGTIREPCGRLLLHRQACRVRHMH